MSAVEVTLQKEAKLILSISLNIEVCIFKSSPFCFVFFFAASNSQNIPSQIALYVLLDIHIIFNSLFESFQTYRKVE